MSVRRSLSALLPLALLGASAAATPAAAVGNNSGAAASAKPQPPTLRLDDRARPTLYRLRVKIPARHLCQLSKLRNQNYRAIRSSGFC